MKNVARSDIYWTCGLEKLLRIFQHVESRKPERSFKQNERNIQLFIGKLITLLDHIKVKNDTASLNNENKVITISTSDSIIM